MKQEEEDHQRDDDQLLDERVLERVDAGANERRSVIGRDDLDALRQGGLYLSDARLDRIDHLEGVGTRPRHDHSSDDLALAVQVREPAALGRTDPHGADVAQQHGRPHVGS